jgi:hypothetical protein
LIRFGQDRIDEFIYGSRVMLWQDMFRHNYFANRIRTSKSFIAAAPRGMSGSLLC